MKFPKPASRKQEKAAKKARRKAHIAKIRRQVSMRDRRCRICGELFGVGELTPEMHELQSRAHNCEVDRLKNSSVWKTASCFIGNAIVMSQNIVYPSTFNDW